MRFVPKSEEELSNLLDEGVYDFEVVHAEDAVSKKSNDMIKVQLRVFDHDGGSVTVFDYLLESVLYKIAHIAAATGLVRQYERGEMTAADLHGKVGRVKIGIQPPQNGYPAKNAVKDYVARPSGSNGAAAPAASALRQRAMAPAGDVDLADDIPF